MYTVAEIEKAINEFAPFKLAADWDNSGFQVGDKNAVAENILISLNTTEEAIDEAIELNSDLIITHHPLLFSSVNKIEKNQATGNIIYRLIKNDISLISAHTNIDRSEEGLNNYLAHKLSLKNISFLQQDENMNKLVVFVPEENLEDVKFALHESGAGKFEKYDMTGFYTPGTGTFRALEGSKPAVGETENYNQVEEYRLETIFPARKIDMIIEKLIQVHPYEEPAFDVINLEQHQGELLSARKGIMSEPDLLSEFIERVKNTLQLDRVRFMGDVNKKINSVAIACGSGSDFIGEAKVNGADVLLTGDMKYHDWEKAYNMGLFVVDAGHFGTEKMFGEYLKNKLANLVSDDLKIKASQTENGYWSSK